MRDRLSIFLFFLMFTQVLWAQSPVYEVEKTYEKDGVNINVNVEKTNIDVVDTIRVQLKLEIAESVDVTLPQLSMQLDEYEFGVLEYKIQPKKLLDNNRVLYQHDYLLEPIVTGQFNIPSLEFSWGKDEQGQKILTEPIQVTIGSDIDGKIHGEELTGIKSNANVTFEKNNQWVWWFCGGLFVLWIIVVAFGLLDKGKDVKRLYKSAHQLAYEKLDDLEKEALTEQNRHKEFYEKISFILRWYIEVRFDLNAPDLTTEEFFQAVNKSNALNQDHAANLKRFLEHCDMVKFAKYSPGQDEMDQSAVLVRQFVKSTVDYSRQVDVTDKTIEFPVDVKVIKNA